jgi:hypothetical protein
MSNMGLLLSTYTCGLFYLINKNAGWRQLALACWLVNQKTQHNTTVFVFVIPGNKYSLHFIKWLTHMETTRMEGQKIQEIGRVMLQGALVAGKDESRTKQND